ncbi:MAG: hypothetical protein HOV87_04190, partial [Catenulispora sp.]|nr:hypothetical protein [Catenulispora sp.]
MTIRALFASWRRFAPAAWRRPATAALALLAAVIVAADLGIARVDLGQRTRAERSLIDTAAPGARTITVRSALGFTGTTAIDAGIVADSRVRLYQAMSPTVPLRSADDGWGLISFHEAPVAPDPSGTFAAPDKRPVVVDLAYLDTLDRHARLVSGRWPAAQPAGATQGATTGPTQSSPTAPTAPTAPTTAAEPPPLESVVSAATAALMHLDVGSVYTATLPNQTEKLRVVGIIEPIDPHDLFWAANGYLMTPVHQRPLGAPDFWSTGVLVGVDQARVLPGYPDVPTLTWTFPIDSHAGDADRAGSLVAALGRLELAADAAAGNSDTNSDGAVLQIGGRRYLLPMPVSITSGLPAALAPFLHAQRVEGLELAMPLAGLALIAAVAAALLAAAAVADRGTELAARRARGCSARQATIRMLADGLVTALPAAALGVLGALLAPGRTPSGTLPTAVVIGALIAVAPAAGVAWLEVVRRRALRSAGRERTRSGIRARRWIAQGTLGVMCVGGLLLIRSRGLTPAGDVDPYAAAAPVLAAGLAALVTVNLLPPVLRVSLRLSARRGVAGVLGLTRAAAAPFSVQAADVVLTAGICTAGLTFALGRLALDGGGAELRTATKPTFGFLGWLSVAAAVGAVALAGWLGSAAT